MPPAFHCRSAVAVARENGIAGNVFQCPKRWLSVRLRQNGKNRVRSYLLRNGSYGATAGGNGNGTSATERWKPGIRRCPTIANDCAVATWDGRLFQKLAPKTGLKGADLLIGLTHAQETCTRNFYQRLTPNRTQLYSVRDSYIRNFQTQPTNQTARFWSRESAHVYGTSFPYQPVCRLNLSCCFQFQLWQKNHASKTSNVTASCSQRHRLHRKKFTTAASKAARLSVCANYSSS